MTKIMRIGGRDPQGNAKGFNTDTNGDMVIRHRDIASEVVNTGASSSETTKIFEVPGELFKLVVDFTSTEDRELDVHWLDHKGDDLYVDDNVLTGSGEKEIILDARSSRCKFTVRNLHTSARFNKIAIIPWNIVRLDSGHDAWDAVIAAEDSVETVTYNSQGTHISITLDGGNFGGKREVDIHWLNRAGKTFMTDENVISKGDPGDEVGNVVIPARSPYFKATIRNTHTSARQVMVTFGVYSGVDTQVVKKTEERIRMLGAATVSISHEAASKSVEQRLNEALFGTLTGFTAKPVMIWFSVNTDNDHSYKLSYRWRVRQGGENVIVTDHIDAIVTTNRRESSDWQEVKGSWPEIFLENDSEQVREYNVSMWGIF